MTRSLIRLAPLALIALIAAAGCSGAGASPSTDAASPSVSAPAPASPSGSAGASPSASPADIEVTGVEYAFEGMPATVQSGAVLGFRNGGQELHEMAVYRRNDDVTQSFEEILAMPPDEGIKLVSEAGVVFAAPGEVATDTVAITQPGDYAMLCFVPVGMTELPSMDPNATPDVGGPPHFTRGMLHLFTVSG